MENKEITETQKTDLKSLSKKQLSEYLEDLGLQSYRSDQVFQWLYQKGVSSFEEMTNLSKDLRATLSELAEICLLYTSPSPRDRTRSRMPSSA